MPRAFFPDGSQVVLQLEGTAPQIGMVIGDPLLIAGTQFYWVNTGHYEALYPADRITVYPRQADE